MAAQALLEDLANVILRINCTFRDHPDFQAHDDRWLICLFRLSAAVLELCEGLSPLQPKC